MKPYYGLGTNLRTLPVSFNLQITTMRLNIGLATQLHRSIPGMKKPKEFKMSSGWDWNRPSQFLMVHFVVNTFLV